MKTIIKKNNNPMLKSEETKTEMQEKIDAELVANRVTLLFAFCGELIQYLPILEKVMTKADNHVSTSMALAPVMGAMGMDWEENQFEVNLRAKRAAALHNLIKVLDETEKERVEFDAKKVERAKGQAIISSIFR